MASIHWYDPQAWIPEEFIDGFVGVGVNMIVDNENIEQTVREIEISTGCINGIHPLGQVIDDDGLYHYAFIVHPKDTLQFDNITRRYFDRDYFFHWAHEQHAQTAFPEEIHDLVALNSTDRRRLRHRISSLLSSSTRQVSEEDSDIYACPLPKVCRQPDEEDELVSLMYTLTV